MTSAFAEKVGLEVPAFTRAHGADDDEDLDRPLDTSVPAPVEFSWSTTTPAPPNGVVECDHMIIACGAEACTFMRLYTPINQSLSSPDGHLVIPAAVAAAAAAAKPKRNQQQQTRLYHNNNHQAMYVLVEGTVTDDRVNEWTSTLFQHIHAKRVTILTSLPMVEHTPFRVDEERVPPMLRRLATRTAAVTASEKSVMYLTPPNMIAGVAAAILTHCEVYGLNAQCFVTIVNRHYLVESVRAFEPLVPSIIITDNTSPPVVLVSNDDIHCTLESYDRLDTPPPTIFL